MREGSIRARVKLDRLFPVNGLDIATGFALRQPFFFGLDKVIGPLAEGRTRRWISDPCWTRRRRAIRSAIPISMDGNDNGSNAFAIAPAKSGDGTTRLVSNTHQPWRGPVAWYELVVESDEGWHYAGATFPGRAFPLLGHNETLGWTNTVNRPDLVDVYRLILDPKAAPKYRLDGEWKPLEQTDITAAASKSARSRSPIRRTVWRSEHGPVIKTPKGEAFAIRYGGMGRIDQLTEYYRLNKAKDYAEWSAALSDAGDPFDQFHLCRCGGEHCLSL